MRQVKAFPLISVVLPNWNTQKDIIEFLSSLSAQTYPKSAMEVIIVDNGSKDGSVQAIKQWYRAHRSEGWRRLELIALSRNMGIAAGYNTAYANCSPESFAILRVESDVILSPHVVTALAEALVESPEIGIAGSRAVLYASPGKIDHAARNMDPWTGHLHGFDSSVRVDCDCVFGGTFIVRRSCIEEMGFFFDKNRFFASELELSIRVKKQGYRVIFEPKAIAYHKFSRSTRLADQSKLRYLDRKELTLVHMVHIPFPRKLFYLAFSAAFCLKQACKGNKMYLLGLRDGVLTGLLHSPVYLRGIRRGQDAFTAEWSL